MDSGADENYIHWKLAKRLKLRQRRKEEPYILRGIEGKKTSHNKGTVTQETELLRIQLNGKKRKESFDLTEIGDHQMILGRRWLQKENPWIDWTTGKVHIKMKEALRASKKDDTQLPKHQPWDHEINLKEGAQLKTGPIYKMSDQELRTVKDYIDKNLERKFIRPSFSKFGSPVLFVPKKNGELRLCVDYRQLNMNTIKDKYPLPLISELHDRVSGTQWFTKLDLKEAYYLIRIKEGDEWKTTFRTRYGQYEYLVMPFGLTNAPATFQRLINQVLHHKLDHTVMVYIDDILIYTKGTKEEHERETQEVLQLLKEYDIRLNEEKSEFSKKEVTFLGTIISRDGLRMEPEKTKAVREWPTPKTVKEVQAFLGFANYYRRFIKNYSSQVGPLTQLTRKDQKFEWGPHQEEAFEGMKALFTNESTLESHNPEKKLTVEILGEESILQRHDADKKQTMKTDTSQWAIAACLSQSSDGKRGKPVAFHSRKLTPAEQNYDIHDKELLAIVDAFKHWRHYLQGARHEVSVITDHKNLTSFTTTKVLNKRQVRWAEELSSYNFKISYRKGTENQAADALSRRTDYMESSASKEMQILRRDEEGNL